MIGVGHEAYSHLHKVPHVKGGGDEEVLRILPYWTPESSGWVHGRAKDEAG